MKIVNTLHMRSQGGQYVVRKGRRRIIYPGKPHLRRFIQRQG